MNYHEKDFGENNRQYEPERIEYKLALKLMEKEDFGPRALDVGAGKGEFADMLEARGYQVSCVEGNERLRDSLEERGYETAGIDLEDDPLPFPEDSFDLVVSLEVIEHLWNTDHYLSELERVVKPGGAVIITTPNHNHWTFRILSLLGKAERYLTQDYHKKLFTVHSLRRRMEPYFTVEKTRGRGMLPKIYTHFPVPAFLNLCSMHVGVLARKRREQSNRK